MNKYFKLGGIASSLAVIFLIWSCKDKDDTPQPNTNTAVNTNSATDKDASSRTSDGDRAVTLTGKLDTLWIESKEFDKLPNRKLVMSFFITPGKALTLHGWPCTGIVCGFDNDPAIRLKNRGATSVAYGPGVYFASPIITEVNKVQKKAEKFLNIVFIPYLDGAYIKYKIYVTNDELTKYVKVLALEETGVDTNPSPPKH